MPDVAARDPEQERLLRRYDDDSRHPRPDRPYVIVNMVASIDGITSVEGRSRGLGHPLDRAVFLHLRDLADAILVGATTARAEHYGPARPSAAARDARIRRGQPPRPPIVVVSRSMRFDWTTPFFTEADPPPILLVPSDADPEALAVASGCATVVEAGEGASVDLGRGLARLRERGIGVLLCEGGPTLNAALLQLGAIDELCLTVSPQLLGTGPDRLFASTAAHPALRLTLAHVACHDDVLFLRYRRHPDAGLRPADPTG